MAKLFLNDLQKQAVAHNEGHAVINAGPGSGKTTVLTHMIARRCREGLSPDAMLVLMFGRDTKADFEVRLAAQMPSNRPTVSTIHAIARHILVAIEGEGAWRLIETDAYWLSVLRSVVRRLHDEGVPEISAMRKDDDFLKEILGAISYRKSALASKKISGLTDITANLLFDRYEMARASARARSFDDLIYDLLNLDPAQLHHQVAGWKYEIIFVDEFQDLSLSQMHLLKLLAGQGASIIAVGDRNQSIYGWRGSLGNSMDAFFETFFGACTRYELTETHRFGAAVAALANGIINDPQNDQQGRGGAIHSGRNDTIVSVRMGDPAQIAATVAVRNARDGNEIAVLVREYTETPWIEALIIKEGQSYTIEGAPKVFERPWAYAIRSWMEIAAGTIDRHRHSPLIKKYVQGIVSLPNRFLSADVIEQIVAESRVTGLLGAFTKVLGHQEHNGRYARLIDGLVALHRNGGKMTCAQVFAFAEDCFGLSGYFDSRCTKGSQKRRLDEFYAFKALILDQHGNVRRALAYIDALTELHASAGESCLLITSMHRAKGREWNHVVIPSLIDDLMPSETEDIQAERRLLFVAATRARKSLSLALPIDSNFKAKLNGDGHMDSRMVVSRLLYDGVQGLNEARRLCSAITVSA